MADVIVCALYIAIAVWFFHEGRREWVAGKRGYACLTFLAGTTCAVSALVIIGGRALS